MWNSAYHVSVWKKIIFSFFEECDLLCVICCAARYIVDYVIGYLRTLVTSFIYISYLVPGFRLLHAAANVRQSLPERDRGGERKGERERSWERGDGHGDGKRGRGGGRKGCN